MSTIKATVLRTGVSQRTRQRRAAYFLALPFMALFVALLVIPLGYAGYLSLFKSKLIGGTVFVGIDNYVRALADSAFLESVARMFLFLVTSTPLGLLASLLLALALDSGRVRGSRFFRLAIFVPYAVPGVVATLMWGFLYGPTFGPITQIFEAFGLEAPNLLSAENITPAIMNILWWEFIGYNMIIFYAALRNIPQELYDAAHVDGANQWQIAWNIKLPALRPALLFAVTFAIIGTFQLFNEPNLLYTLAPASIGTSYSPNLYAFNLAFVQRDVNYSAAIAFALAVVVAGISFGLQTFFQRRADRAK
jgi:multiple sugar transport system permease protein